jgi:hypothetical protein
MARDRDNKPETYRSSQAIQNWSFDEVLKVLSFQLLTYDPITGLPKRVTPDSLNAYGTNDVDKASSTVVYEGLEDADGGWQIVQISTSGNVTSNRFATQENNSAVTSYSDAWSGRAGLTYGYYSEAF